MKIETAKRASVRGADEVGESRATLWAIIDLTIKELFHLSQKEIFITLLFIYSPLKCAASIAQSNSHC